jgi:hypothetical protein
LQEQATAVAVDKNGTVYSCGTFTNLAYFNGSNFMPFTHADKRAYLAVLDEDLNWQSLEFFGEDDDSDAYTEITAITVNNDKEEIYIAGKSNYDIDIDDSAYTNLGRYDMFFLKKDFDMNTIYSAYAGGPGNEEAKDIFPYSANEVFVAGNYSNNTVLGNNTYPLSNSYDKQAVAILNEYIPPPPPWEVPVLSSNTATVEINESILPKINGHAPKKGDAIGIFYSKGGELKCAGFTVYMKDDITIVVRGDNPGTGNEDGCPDDAIYFFKTWDGELQQEFLTDANIATGPRYYKKSATTVIEHLPMQDVSTYTVALNKGWNMISAPIAPRIPISQTVIDSSENPDRIFLVKNGSGQITLPDYGIDNIDAWDARSGYLMYCTAATDFTVSGESIDTATESIALSAGWNMFAYWGTTEEDIDSVLAGIADEIFLVKNGSGRINLPDYGIKQIDNMIPGEGYLIYMKNDAILEFD